MGEVWVEGNLIGLLGRVHSVERRLRSPSLGHDKSGAKIKRSGTKLNKTWKKKRKKNKGRRQGGTPFGVCSPK